jgi:hypothetical protein
VAEDPAKLREMAKMAYNYNYSTKDVTLRL